MTDRDREAFEAWCAATFGPNWATHIWSPERDMCREAWQAALAHAHEAGAQEPVAAYEFGRSNGDGTFSVHIERSLPAQVHPDWPVTKFYTHPAPAQEPVAVPAGWKLVPVEPTREMWAAMADTLYRYKNRHHDKVAADLWSAGLTAAPVCPAANSGERDLLEALRVMVAVVRGDEHPELGSRFDRDDALAKAEEALASHTPASQPGSEPKGCPTPGACSCPQPGGAATRPAKCRFRLEDEGKPHPKSGCEVPGCRGVFGALCRAALSPSPSGWDAGAWNPTHRHVKRGSEYRVIGEASAQVSKDRMTAGGRGVRVLGDGDSLTVYQGTDGKLWVRFSDEFNDGRFSPLPTPPAGEGR